jgi:hypothetical protein
MADANTFLKLGAIRTHLDGVGRRGNVVVVVELKSTTRPIGAAMDVYDAPCAKQPCVAGSHTNTERLHHQLQLGWGVMAYRKLVQSTGVTGVIVVAAADGARLMWLDETYASPAFWARALAAAPPRNCRAAAAAPKMPKWPGDAATAALEAAAGVRTMGLINGRVMTLACGGAAVVSLRRASATTTAERKRMVAAIRAASRGMGWVVYPCAGAWQAAPIHAAKQARV